jgi:hypothetical protein
MFQQQNFPSRPNKEPRSARKCKWRSSLACTDCEGEKRKITSSTKKKNECDDFSVSRDDFSVSHCPCGAPKEVFTSKKQYSLLFDCCYSVDFCNWDDKPKHDENILSRNRGAKTGTRAIRRLIIGSGIDEIAGVYFRTLAKGPEASKYLHWGGTIELDTYPRLH